MQQQKKRFSKKLYVYLAFVTMAAVSLFAKPLKRGFHSLNKRLKNASHKGNLRLQLGLAEQNFKAPSKKKRRSY